MIPLMPALAASPHDRADTLSIAEGRRHDPMPRPMPRTPVFLPDATRGIVRGLMADDLERAGIEALMVNAFHLSRTPGASVVKKLGGIHRLMGFDGLVMSDSGGFQALSMFREGGARGGISDEGLWWKDGGEKRWFTPEQSIRAQLAIGADVIFCLDDCGPQKSDRAVHVESVERTLTWARRCKAVFEAATLDRRPRLYAVVQGGPHRDLRDRCAGELLAMGFDGFGFGGWPVAEDGLLVEEVSFVREIIPREFPLHGLGIGRPDSLIQCHALGYTSFDCTHPTRAARRGQLFVLDAAAAGFSSMRIEGERNVRDAGPIDPGCDAVCCTRTSRAYLHHLFNVDEASAHRLATLHNLRFMTRLTDRLRR